MLHNNTKLVDLKHSLSPVSQVHQGISATIGLLSYSGLNHTQQMPEMCHLLQILFNLNSCGFFWADSDGNMQDAWSTTPGLLSFKTLMSCLEYQASDPRAWPTFQENVLIGPIAGYLLPFQNARFYDSSHYRDVYNANNIRHILDVVLHDGKRPYGVFLLMRNAQQGRFTPDERRLMEQLIPVFNKAFTIQNVECTQYAEKEMTGFALVGTDGRYKSMSEEARRIVWMLSHDQPGSFAQRKDASIEAHLEKLVATQLDWISPGGKFSVVIDNRWGRFHLVFEQEPQLRDTIVTLRRKVPLASRLAFCLAKHNLPPMRQMVAWLLAQNQSRNQIASALGISVETVTSHIKLIYKATGTSSSHGLLFKLAS